MKLLSLCAELPGCLRTINFPFGTDKINRLVVLILMHIRVYLFISLNDVTEVENDYI